MNVTLTAALFVKLLFIHAHYKLYAVSSKMKLCVSECLDDTEEVYVMHKAKVRKAVDEVLVGYSHKFHLRK